MDVPETKEPVINAYGVETDSFEKSAGQFNDAVGFWRTFFGSAVYKWRWRWSREPHLYYPARWEYKDVHEFITVDAVGRKIKRSKPFESTIDPTDTRIEKICVQTTDSLCKTANCTWDRTVIRSVGSPALRLALLPFRKIPRKRRDVHEEYTSEDWAMVLALWIPSVVGLVFGGVR
jgi:hypothetical protein